ncbi:MAG: hypothetical protein H0X64_14060 [Gemmatimonadaceae bacterium]|nr:hypothetical protein [Gemmatimonadaceae bacterium]
MKGALVDPMLRPHSGAGTPCCFPAFRPCTGPAANWPMRLSPRPDVLRGALGSDDWPTRMGGGKHRAHPLAARLTRLPAPVSDNEVDPSGTCRTFSVAAKMPEKWHMGHGVALGFAG